MVGFYIMLAIGLILTFGVLIFWFIEIHLKYMYNREPGWASRFSWPYRLVTVIVGLAFVIGSLLFLLI